MAARAIKSMQRPRELRRRVVVPARVRTDGRWCDARILNISSRGLLIHSSYPVLEGTIMQIVRGDHLIVARVVWSDGSRTGLKSEDQLPVEEIVSLKQAQVLQLIASDGAIRDRRKQPRGIAVDSRLHGRSMEFVAVLLIAAALAASGSA